MKEFEKKTNPPREPEGVKGLSKFLPMTESAYRRRLTEYEIQIQDDRDPEHRTGSNYGFVPAIKLASRPAGEWNNYEIIVVGQQYVIRLNGETVCEFTGNRALEGYIGLQNHDDKSIVSFRNVRIKKL